MRTGIIAGSLMWVIVLVLLTGCGSTRGWQVSFGVHPVSETTKTEKLNEKGK